MINCPPAILRHGIILRLLPVIAASCVATPLAAQATPAGVIIESTAEATYEDGGTTRSVSSNPVQVRVDEVLSLAIAARDAGPVTVRSGPAVLSFLVTNTGNGPEQFILDPVVSVAGNSFDAGVTDLAADTNGNSVYDAGIDAILPAPATTASLAADESQTIFALLAIPSGLADGATSQITLNARAATGNGAPGTVFPGAGDGGGDAVAGASGASASSNGQLIVSASSVTLLKWASVEDPFGGSAAVPGATVTYSIQTLVTGSADLNGLVVTDAIPPRTTYRPGTLRRDGSALTDAANDDAGEASMAGIRVNLGTLAGGSSSTVSFSVSIND